MTVFATNALLIASLLVLVPSALGAPTSVVVLNAETFVDIAQDKSKFLLLHIFASWSPQSKEFSGEFARLPDVLRTKSNMTAEQLDSIVLAKLNGVKYESIARRYRLNTFPGVLLFNGNLDHYLHYTGEHHDDSHYTAEDVARFLEYFIVKKQETEFLDEEAKRLYFEKNLPHPSVGKIVNLTEDTFDKYALDPRRTVFVLFYSPWCRWCGEMHEVLSKVAEYFKNDYKVIIGRVKGEDAPNLMTRYKIDAFPAMMIFTKGKHGKQGMNFAGHRDEEHIRAYIDSMNSAVFFDEGHVPFTDQFVGHDVNHGNVDRSPFGHDAMAGEAHSDGGGDRSDMP